MKWSSEIRRHNSHAILLNIICIYVFIYSSYIALLIIHHTLHSISLRLLNSTAAQGFAVRQRIQCVYNSSVFQLAKFIYTHTDTQSHSYTYTDRHTITHSQMIKSLNKHFYRLVSGRKEKSELPFCGQHCCVSRAVRSHSPQYQVGVPVPVPVQCQQMPIMQTIYH